MKKYKIICIVLTTILICITMSYIGIRVFDRIDSKNKIKQEIISKLTEEELSNVNINELVEDITGGIKYAKKVDKKGNSVEDVIYSTGRYEGDGYIISYKSGGEDVYFSYYGYYCGDKEVYSKFVGESAGWGFGNPFKDFIDFIKENKKAIVCGIFITTLIIADIIYFIKYKKSKRRIE